WECRSLLVNLAQSLAQPGWLAEGQMAGAALMVLSAPQMSYTSSGQAIFTSGSSQEKAMESARRNSAKRTLMSVIAACAWLALLLQLLLMIRDAHAAGTSIATAVWNYFSFFTILTNLLVASSLTLSLCAPESRRARFFSRPAAVAGTAIYITLVGATYALLLRAIYNPQGSSKFADTLLHDFVPIAYVAYWLIFASKRGLRWRHAFLWLIYPGVYAVYIFVRGHLTGWYPYPFINSRTLGFSHALANAAIIGAIVLAAGLLVVAASRQYSANQSSPAE
ncbi:MAG: Pr6Pr family membrane protein, partial [Candidatus Acidiferrales bacterium]